MGLGALTDVIAPERVVGLPVGEVSGARLRLAPRRRRARSSSRFPASTSTGTTSPARPSTPERSAVVVERELTDVGAPQLVVDRTRRALADAADAWFGRPSERLTVIGVTGTDGKSTVTALTADVLRAGRGAASGPDRHRVRRHRRRGRAERGPRDDARGAGAPGDAGRDGRRRQRQRGHGGDVARPGAGADAQLPLRRRPCSRRSRASTSSSTARSRPTAPPRRAWSRRRRSASSTPMTPSFALLPRAGAGAGSSPTPSTPMPTFAPATSRPMPPARDSGSTSPRWQRIGSRRVRRDASTCRTPSPRWRVAEALGLDMRARGRGARPMHAGVPGPHGAQSMPASRSASSSTTPIPRTRSARCSTSCGR